MAERDVILKRFSGGTSWDVLYPKTKIGNVDGLQEALELKAESSHSHSVATVSSHGFMSVSDKTRLDSMDYGAQVNVPTNLSQGARNATTLRIDSSTGSNVTLPAVTTSLAGLMTSTDKTRLDVLHSLLEEDTANNVVDSINEVLAIFNNYPEGADLVTALAGKVDKVSGKGLSTNDYTTTEKNKLSGIATGATNLKIGTTSTTAKAGNYHPTWSQVTSKPTFATVATSGSYNDLTNKPSIPSAYTLTKTNIDTVLKGSGDNTLSLGHYSKADGNSSIAFGEDAEAGGGGSIALGNGARAEALNSIAIGRNTVVTEDNVVDFGSTRQVRVKETPDNDRDGASKKYVDTTVANKTVSYSQITGSKPPVGATTNTGTVTSVTTGTQISGLLMTVSSNTTTPMIETSISNAANFRSAIGAGTSSLTIGTTASTAKAGNYQPSYSDITGSKPPVNATTNTGTVTNVSAGTTQVSGLTLSVATGGTTPVITTSISNAANFRTAIGAGTGSSNLALGEKSSTAYRGDRGKTAYDHSQAAHAPSNAQKNSDITKAEIEAKLTETITSHTHNASSLIQTSSYRTVSDLEKENWNNKFNTPTGTTSQYIRGNGSLATFPSIPAAQVQSDWNATTGMGVIKNKPNLATVATSGNYNDLSNRPSGLWKQVYSGTSGNLPTNTYINLTLNESATYYNRPMMMEIKYGNSGDTYTNQIVTFTLGTDTSTGNSKSLPRVVSITDFDGRYFKTISVKVYASTNGATSSLRVGYVRTLIGDFTGTSGHLTWTTQSNDVSSVYIGKIWVMD